MFVDQATFIYMVSLALFLRLIIKITHKKLTSYYNGAGQHRRYFANNIKQWNDQFF